MKKFILAILFLLIVSGCSSREESQWNIGEQRHLPNGDKQERTVSNDQLPRFLDQQGEGMKQIYLAAAANQELLQWIPCYCGCANSGHRSNADCFYKSIEKDQSIIWDDHATRCNTCLEIAVESMNRKMKGESVQEIRKWVDTTYGNGNYAQPTPTPMP